MKPKLTILAAIVLCAAMTSWALAQTEGAVTNFDENYLDRHPEIAHQLGRIRA